MAKTLGDSSGVEVKLAPGDGQYTKTVGRLNVFLTSTVSPGAFYPFIASGVPSMAELNGAARPE
jgi:hypothetical protein